MPPKNTIKTFIPDGYYHLYNRGVEKRTIFLDNHDFHTFLYLLKKYLSPPSPKQIKQEKLYQQINLIVYCLMPNHFHLLIKQTTKDAITQLIRRISTNYAMFFNKKYKRVGPLFQGIYKAVFVETTEQLIHLSRYIHLNPKNYQTYPYSSYSSFVGKNKRKWLKPEEILAIFKENNAKAPKLAYQKFVQEFKEEEISSIESLVLEQG